MGVLPHYKQQTPFTCSLACLRMVLESIGRKFTETELAKVIGFSPRRGFSIPMMTEICEILNLDYDFKSFAELQDLRSYILNGFSPIVIISVKIYQNISEDHGHAIVVRDIRNKSVIINDPDIEFGGEDKKVELEIFLRAWSKSRNWVLVIRGERK